MKRVRLIITGFSSFSNVKLNPTEVLVNEINEWLDDKLKATLLRKKVLIVAADDVKEDLILLQEEVNKDATSSDFDLWIHLGVDTSTTHTKLEMKSFNNASFRVPDVRGYQPLNEKIILNDTFNQIRKTGLPLENISKAMSIPISQDCGLYLCNFAYYISLYYQTSCEKGDSLFIHIPPFETQKKEVTSSQINLIINYLVDFCSGSSSLVTQPSTLPLTPLLRGGEIKSHISINNSDKEIIDSLQSLGFNINQIKSAMSSLPLVCTVEELIERMFNLENNNEMEKEEKKESDDIKMVLVARNDLKMGKGKLAAQCSHATLGCYRIACQSEIGKALLSEWEWRGEMKVVVKVESEEEIVGIEAECYKKGVCNYLVIDAGKTQIKAGSKTVIAVFGRASDVDMITGELKLM